MMISLKNTYYLFILLAFMLFSSTKIQSQIIVRLVEAEASALANTTVLALIKPAEDRVKKAMKQWNTKLNQQVPYYGYLTIFTAIFQINTTITRITTKITNATRINERTPRLFNWKKVKNRNKLLMYTRFLKSIRHSMGNDISNNGNLLKTSMEIVGALENTERDIDEMTNKLIIAHNASNLF